MSGKTTKKVNITGSQGSGIREAESVTKKSRVEPGNQTSGAAQCTHTVGDDLDTHTGGADAGTKTGGAAQDTHTVRADLDTHPDGVDPGTQTDGVAPGKETGGSDADTVTGNTGLETHLDASPTVRYGKTSKIGDRTVTAVCVSLGHVTPLILH